MPTMAVMKPASSDGERFEEKADCSFLERAVLIASSHPIRELSSIRCLRWLYSPNGPHQLGRERHFRAWPSNKRNERRPRASFASNCQCPSRPSDQNFGPLSKCSPCE